MSFILKLKTNGNTGYSALAKKPTSPYPKRYDAIKKAHNKGYKKYVH